jgi:hypothetical protein
MGDSVKPDDDLEDELRGKAIARAEDYDEDEGKPEFWD